MVEWKPWFASNVIKWRMIESKPWFASNVTDVKGTCQDMITGL